jgi:hypothetical protein
VYCLGMGSGRCRIKDRDIKSCLEGRDKTPSVSRRPVPGYQ